ncbi:uncharacterized protein A4U43_C03F8980, partial [Asparagus officinalis]
TSFTCGVRKYAEDLGRVLPQLRIISSTSFTRRVRKYAEDLGRVMSQLRIIS